MELHVIDKAKFCLGQAEMTIWDLTKWNKYFAVKKNQRQRSQTINADIGLPFWLLFIYGFCPTPQKTIFLSWSDQNGSENCKSYSRNGGGGGGEAAQDIVQR